MFVHRGPWMSGPLFQALLEFGEMKCKLLCTLCWHSWAMPPLCSAPLWNVPHHNLPVISLFPEGTEDANHEPFSHGLHIRQSEIFLLLGRKMAQRAKSAQVCIVLPAKRLHPREKSTLYLDKRQTFCSFMFIWHFLNMFIEMRMAQNFIFHIKLPRILRQQFCYCNRGVF